MSKINRPNEWMTVPPQEDDLTTSIFQLTLAVMYLADVLAAPPKKRGKKQ